VLKNGCLVEELQLATLPRIERAMALFMVVSWRIAQLMRMERTCPDLPAKLFFDADEIQGNLLAQQEDAAKDAPQAQ